MKRLRSLLRIIFGRTTFVVLFVLIQLAILFGCFQWLSEYIIYVYGGFTGLTVLVVIYILNKKEEPNYKLAWIIPILTFPIFGTLFFVFVELEVGTRLIAGRLKHILEETKVYLLQDENVKHNLKQESGRIGSLAHYMNEYGGYPIYQNTHAEYFPSGEEMFEEMKKQLKAAEKFIFMEYFIVERGMMWNSILDILEEKAKEGVEVRVMYDGMCWLTLLPYHYPDELEKKGIRCKMFAPVKPALSTYQNNRDHRKITVIDGHTAFTGGINLADEYINEKKRFGYWKDVAVMVKGDAVKSFTMMFLQLWNITEKQKEIYDRYIPSREEYRDIVPSGSGYVMPYGDSPLDHETVGEHVYLDILYQAKKYVHIMTPYLILDNDMVTALTYAAKRGIETIIIMPHIPDKKYAYLLARSYYWELLDAGVRIFEFTPGFVHAKVYVSDDEKAVVGTINMDYRSLYLHFECAAYLYRNTAVGQVEDDYQNTLKKCQEITLEDCRRYPVYKKIAGSVLRLFAPLM
ncbi:cardiolipin synthase [Clostridium sp. AM58-1XD]|uniref:cardiolipin synthase n=1 Tax=Clostridium sp. AM58-1XD TaxID=2292307 RepID=UPI000E494746|nr:cardiolipin synthase [Clostridium sp. AM58-1XD]RGY99462.1 cardiolipin synthase [Clostridium sp. AM58-1XD]